MALTPREVAELFTVNALMIGPGNYKLRDFFRTGWPLSLISFLVLLLGMRLFWGV